MEVDAGAEPLRPFHDAAQEIRRAHIGRVGTQRAPDAAIGGAVPLLDEGEGILQPCPSRLGAKVVRSIQRDGGNLEDQPSHRILQRIEAKGHYNNEDCPRDQEEQHPSLSGWEN
jgi:hypothetical protein